MGRGNPAGSASRIPTAPGALGAAGPAGLAFLWGFCVFFSQPVGELLAPLAALLPWAGCRGSRTGLCLHPQLPFWCRQPHQPLSFPPSTALLGGWAGTGSKKAMQGSRTRPAPAQHPWGHRLSAGKSTVTPHGTVASSLVCRQSCQHRVPRASVSPLSPPAPLVTT